MVPYTRGIKSYSIVSVFSWILQVFQCERETDYWWLCMTLASATQVEYVFTCMHSYIYSDRPCHPLLPLLFPTLLLLSTFRLSHIPVYSCTSDRFRIVLFYVLKPHWIFFFWAIQKLSKKIAYVAWRSRKYLYLWDYCIHIFSFPNFKKEKTNIAWEKMWKNPLGVVRVFIQLVMVKLVSALKRQKQANRVPRKKNPTFFRERNETVVPMTAVERRRKLIFVLGSPTRKIEWNCRASEL